MEAKKHPFDIQGILDQYLNEFEDNSLDHKKKIEEEATLHSKELGGATFILKESPHPMLHSGDLGGGTLRMEELLCPSLQFEEHGVCTVGLEGPSWSMLSMRRLRHPTLEEEVVDHPTLGSKKIAHITLELDKVRQVMLSLWRVRHPSQDWRRWRFPR